MKKMILSLMVLGAVALTFKAKAQQNTPEGPCGYWGEGAIGASSIYCSNFFVCGSDLIWHRFACPTGLEFNEYTETCDFPMLIDHGCGCTEY